MRIGELAGLVGVTTRAIRHYHHLGLLPEPERRPNGYREYGLRHAVALARVLRLTELGLGLSEVRDVLADDAGRDLAEVLAELDADLARQEAAIRERRKRLRSLLDDAEHGRLSPEGPVSPELAAFFGEMARATAGHTRPESAMAAKDREFLALFDTTASPQDRDAFLTALRPALSTPGAVERAHAVYERLDALADADLADPRTRSAVDEAARTLVDALPDSLLTHLGSEGAQAFAEGRAVRDDGFLEAFLADFAPAQAAAVQRAMGLLARRVADRPDAPREPDGRGSR
ncbi:MerR family transcriptional regulator [Streptomyces formicae]|uniref:Putative MerR-family transcriptional regulator n=1 Tax=Streptomyces formicae TaxID=1616117 RepID=A0A291Q6L6_9ACTN|nr:MerR family transcriptional regulator [Streptomyces formicae]ATL27371.1 putative MerR-family transcriptional regulator [Streptomyces formicae]